METFQNDVSNEILGIPKNYIVFIKYFSFRSKHMNSQMIVPILISQSSLNLLRFDSEVFALN